MDTRGDIVRLARRGLGVAEFSLAARGVGRAVPFDGVSSRRWIPPRCSSRDTIGTLPDAVAARAGIEVAERLNRFTDLARAASRRRPAARPPADLDRGVRHRDCGVRTGPAWTGCARRSSGLGGSCCCARRPCRLHSRRGCDRAALCGSFAEGLRRALLFDALAGRTLDRSRADPARPGQHARERERAADASLDEFDGIPDSPVGADGAQTCALGAPDPSTARLRTPSGRSLILRGSMLGDRAAVDPPAPRAPELRAADRRGLRAHRRERSSLSSSPRGSPRRGRRAAVPLLHVAGPPEFDLREAGVGSRAGLDARGCSSTITRMDLSDFDALTFDCYGTRSTGRRVLAALRPVGGDASATRSCSKVARHEAGSRPARTCATAGVLAGCRAALGRLGFDAVRGPARGVLAFGRRLARVLRQPGRAGALNIRFKLGVITNCDDDLFAASNGGSASSSTGSSPPSRRAATSPPGELRARVRAHGRPARANPARRPEPVPRSRAGEGLRMTTCGSTGRRRDGPGATPPAQAAPDLRFPDLRTLADHACPLDARCRPSRSYALCHEASPFALTGSSTGGARSSASRRACCSSGKDPFEPARGPAGRAR